MMSVIISPVLIPMRDRDVVMDSGTSPGYSTLRRSRHKNQHAHSGYYQHGLGYNMNMNMNGNMNMNMKSRKELRSERRRNKKLARMNMRLGRQMSMSVQRGHYPNSKARSASGAQRAWYSSPTHASNVPHLSI